MKPAPRQHEASILLTGFTPFGGETLNPAWEAIRELDGEAIEGHHISAVQLPTEFGAALPALRKALRRLQPRVAIAVGLAGGRDGISLERVAINVIDARIPDNAGVQPVDIPVVRGGAAAYFTTLPIKSALAALGQADIAAHVSQTAGTYVCNQVFYALMHALKGRRGVRAGFVHVPWSPEQAARHDAPGMPIETAQRGLEIILRCALTTSRDTRISGGAEH